jgi:hypothetical protein
MQFVRISVVVALAVAALACQPPQKPTPPPTAPTPKTQPVSAFEETVTAYLPDPAITDNDASFRGPISVTTLAPTQEGKARLRLTLMGGKHVVEASEVGTVAAALKIDGPLTLGKALGVAEGGQVPLYAVDSETGPNEDPNFTPMCGVRLVNLIAVHQTADKIVLATTSSSFEDGNKGGCSNTIAYVKAP